MVASHPMGATARGHTRTRGGTGALTGANAWMCPLLGLIFVALLAVGFSLVGNAPSSDASGASVISYVTTHQGQTSAAGLLNALAIPAGLAFFVMVRDYLRRSGAGRTAGTVALVGAAVFAVTGALSAGLYISLADVPDKLTPASAQTLNILASDLSSGALVGGLSTMMFGFGAAMLLTGYFATWLGWTTLVIGFIALLGPLSFFALPLTALWVLTVSGVLYARHGEPPDSVEDRGASPTAT